MSAASGRSVELTVARASASSFEIQVRTHEPVQLVDLTEVCRTIAADGTLLDGALHLFCAHTTCGLLINEDEAGFHEDLRRILKRLAPAGEYWAHDDWSRRWDDSDCDMRANGPSHVRACLITQPSLTVPIVHGALALGRWQRLFLVELDGGRDRMVLAQLWATQPPRPPPPARASARAGDSTDVRADLAQMLAVPRLAEDLERVERALEEATRTDDAFFSEVTAGLRAAGGKRVRPLLTLLAAHAGGRAELGERAVTAAVAVELLHLGSLYHDDVLDEASTRRGVRSANDRWGNRVAILGGDFLLARASELAASLGADASRIVATTLAALCRGQVLEFQDVYDVHRTEERYFEAIAGKTAALMEAACRLGAMEAGLERDGGAAFAAFGRSLGLCFQIVDDVLDVVADEGMLGKPAGQDLVEGVYTLPTIRALSRSEELRALLGRPLDAEERERARQLVAGSRSVEEARGVAEALLAESEAALAAATHGNEPLREQTIALARKLVARTGGVRVPGAERERARRAGTAARRRAAQPRPALRLPAQEQDPLQGLRPRP